MYISELNAIQDKLTVSGQVNFLSHLYADGNTEMIVVVFHPHAMSMFLNIPTSFFYNQEVSGYGLENKSLNEPAIRIFNCESNSICISYVEKWLVSQIADNLVDTTYRTKRIDATIQRIYITPQISANELFSIANLNKKQFGRSSHSFVGINSKEYTRIVRFQKALAQMQHQAGKETNRAQITYTGGYVDQSHFTREFKKFCGYTPMSLLKIPNPHSDLFTNPV